MQNSVLDLAFLFCSFLLLSASSPCVKLTEIALWHVLVGKVSPPRATREKFLNVLDLAVAELNDNVPREQRSSFSLDVMLLSHHASPGYAVVSRRLRQILQRECPGDLAS
jgi:hypothetical protein